MHYLCGDTLSRTKTGRKQLSSKITKKSRAALSPFIRLCDRLVYVMRRRNKQKTTLLRSRQTVQEVMKDCACMCVSVCVYMFYYDSHCCAHLFFFSFLSSSAIQAGRNNRNTRKSTLCPPVTTAPLSLVDAVFLGVAHVSVTDSANDTISRKTTTQP